MNRSDQTCFDWQEDGITTLTQVKPVLSDYDEYIVFFSGGRDSAACVLHLLESGVPPEKIELHHHLVDGREGSTLMDWPVTEDYVRKFTQAFNLRLVFTWRHGGFETEMMRKDQPTAPVVLPGDDGALIRVGGTGPKGTRLKFPQVGASLQTRWCSSYLKIDVGARYLTNTARFEDGGKRLIVTGERAEESPGRAKYATFGRHAQDRRDSKRVARWLDHWRPVHAWGEREVWSILERNAVNPHPAYKVGYSRCSCAACIFIDDDSWATLKFLAPAKFKKISGLEDQFGLTIHRTLSVEQRAIKGRVLSGAAVHGTGAMEIEYTDSIRIDNWQLPAGAYQGNGGKF
jgi:3'-phosphoadenosine 5'-phosphosulfate sulfotransferase (PAPS reductase)/FAD synthetase